MTLENYIDSIQKKRIAVIGYGVSNRPLVDLLLSKGCQVTICDQRSREKLGVAAEELESSGAKLCLGSEYLNNLDHDLIFRTPGLMPFDAHLQQARERGAVITSEMEVFFSLCPCKIIAVTGSDGKTTTTTIISELLKAQGYTVHLGGNIGHPLLSEVPEMAEDDYVVLELSSFQLHSMVCKPDIAVITNVSPNHLDKHNDYQDYIDAKSYILKNQDPSCRLVLNANDEQTPYYKKQAKAFISYFSDHANIENGVYLSDGMICRTGSGKELSIIMPAEDILLPGKHNILNYMAAFEATRDLVSDAVCREVAASFRGVEHRLERVRVLNGVVYINDAIGTSPSRTIAGLHALNRKPVLIAGGYDKHIPFDALGEEICRYTKKVFLSGETAEKIRNAILCAPSYAETNLPVFVLDSFDDAVLAACSSAQEGDLVLMSPACASFDQFANFEEKGKHFKKLILDMPEE